MLQLIIDLPLLLVVSLVVVLTVISAEIQRHLGIPQVLGFILTGIILGPLFLGLIDERLLALSPVVTAVALGFIGYNIGHELKLSVARRQSRNLLPLILAQSFGPALLVFILTLIWLKDPIPALLLGALASATAPAATADVIWEYKSRGPVTDAIMYTLILDDVIAIVLTSITMSLVVLVVAPALLPVPLLLATPVIEIGGALLLGASAGLVLAYVLKRVEDHGRYILLLVSVILVLIGIAEFLHFSSLLTSMVLGIVLGNLSPNQAHDLSHEAEKIFSPVILFFFVLFGAGMVDPAVLAIGGIFILVTTFLYVIGRGFGKYLGTRLAANIGDNPPTVKRYLGLCLFSQAGVAVGLSVVIADRLSQLGLPHYGLLIIGVVGISTLVFQIFGPLALKFAIHRAGEANNKIKPSPSDQAANEVDLTLN
ncbi:MAG: cation:proton antiporter [Candidatus Hermodarchaeota archaeon]|nr:cation:proton antiporter [Candidatus Hermodarchaeota archaeon]